MKRSRTRIAKSSAPARSIRQLQRALTTLTTVAPPEDVVHERARALLAHLADVRIPVLIANNRARYVDANRAATDATGYTRDELTRMALWDLTPVPKRALGLRLWRAFLRRGKMTGRYALRRKDGEIVEADYLAVANVLPGVHVSALSIVNGRRSSRRRKRRR
jgi:PAS domain S-box-containing protein